MRKEKLKERHHIIPQVYLNQWKDLNQPKRIIVFCLDKKTLQGQGNSPKNIFVKTHYFTEEALDGSRSHPVEDRLAEKTENKLNWLISVLESEQALTEEVQRELWRFVLSMFMRVFWWREPLQGLIDIALAKAKNQSIDKFIQKSTEGKNRVSRRQAKSKEYRSGVVKDIEHKAPSLMEPLETLFTTKLHPSLVMASLTYEELQAYSFKIVRSDEIPIISSDTPCFIEQDPFILKLSEEEIANLAFVCPLTPKLVFVGGQGFNNGYITPSSEWVRRFNARVRANSVSQLISNTDLVDESWFLEDSNSPPTMREIVYQSGLYTQKFQKKGFGNTRD